MLSPPTFWQTFSGVIFKPLATLRRLEIDEQPLLKGLLALFLVIAGYTLILAIFILRNYPAAAPSLLPLTLAIYSVREGFCHGSNPHRVDRPARRRRCCFSQ